MGTHTRGAATLAVPFPFAVCGLDRWRSEPVLRRRAAWSIGEHCWCMAASLSHSHYGRAARVVAHTAH